MTNEALTDMIVKELGKHHERQEIVRKICEETSLNWGEAEHLMAEVESQNKRKIAMRQGPLLMFLSVGSLILGLGLLVYNMEVLVAIFNADLLSQILSVQRGYYRILSLVTGLGMTVGGFYGIWTTLASFFPN